MAVIERDRIMHPGIGEKLGVFATAHARLVRWRRERERRKVLRRLSTLPDWQLDDVGLTRFDIELGLAAPMRLNAIDVVQRHKRRRRFFGGLAPHADRAMRRRTGMPPIAGFYLAVTGQRD